MKGCIVFPAASQILVWPPAFAPPSGNGNFRNKIVGSGGHHSTASALPEIMHLSYCGDRWALNIRVFSDEHNQVVSRKSHFYCCYLVKWQRISNEIISRFVFISRNRNMFSDGQTKSQGFQYNLLEGTDTQADKPFTEHDQPAQPCLCSSHAHGLL